MAIRFSPICRDLNLIRYQFVWEQSPTQVWAIELAASRRGQRKVGEHLVRALFWDFLLEATDFEVQ